MKEMESESGTKERKKKTEKKSLFFYIYCPLLAECEKRE
jgi:hypothetical protein